MANTKITLGLFFGSIMLVLGIIIIGLQSAEPVSYNNNEYNSRRINETSQRISTVIYDKCEYIIIRATNTPANNIVGITHKGNCKNCSYKQIGAINQSTLAE